MPHYLFDQISSTQNYALNLYQQDETKYQLSLGERVWIQALSQTHGTGKGDRVWHSPYGNFYGSVLIPYQGPGVFLALLGALSIVDVLRQLYNLDVFLKWPNDVWHQNTKIAGILGQILENNAGLLGMGVNLNADPELKTQYSTSTVKQTTGIECDIEAFWQCLDQALPRRVFQIQENFQEFYEQLHDVLLWKGQEVFVQTSDKIVTGILHGVCEKGGVMLKINSFVQSFSALKLARTWEDMSQFHNQPQ